MDFKSERTLFISDIHGQLNALKALLEKVHYNPGTDQLILLGDYVGMNSRNLECLLYIQELAEHHNVVALLGNHDLDLWRYLAAPRQFRAVTPYPYTAALAQEVEHLHPELTYFLGGLQPWFVNERFIAVHAGINPRLLDWQASSIVELTTIREPFLSAPLSVDRTVIFGHTPCLRLHGSPNVWFGPGRIGIDGGAGKGIQLNCLVYYECGFSCASVPV